MVKLLTSLLGAAGIAVMVQDIDRDELVLEAFAGLQGAAGARAPLAQGPRGEAAIRNKLVMLAEPFPEDGLLSGAPTGPVLYAPIRHDNRLFGILQIRRGANESPLTADEQNAATYITGEFGNFLADHSKRVGFKEDQPGRR